MAEIGIIWVAVAYFTRQMRAALRAPLKRRRAYIPAHKPLPPGEVELATSLHEMVEDYRTGEIPVIREDTFGRLALEEWFEMPSYEVRHESNPCLEGLTPPAPPEGIEWLEDFTGSWKRCGDGYQLVGATP